MLGSGSQHGKSHAHTYACASHGPYLYIIFTRIKFLSRVLVCPASLSRDSDSPRTFLNSDFCLSHSLSPRDSRRFAPFAFSSRLDVSRADCRKVTVSLHTVGVAGLRALPAVPASATRCRGSSPTRGPRLPYIWSRLPHPEPVATDSLTVARSRTSTNRLWRTGCQTLHVLRSRGAQCSALPRRAGHRTRRATPLTRRHRAARLESAH